jgi:hypothetical protein
VALAAALEPSRAAIGVARYRVLALAQGAINVTRAMQRFQGTADVEPPPPRNP